VLFVIAVVICVVVISGYTSYFVNERGTRLVRVQFSGDANSATGEAMELWRRKDAGDIDALGMNCQHSDTMVLQVVDFDAANIFTEVGRENGQGCR
jgi:hypothetical protein